MNKKTTEETNTFVTMVAKKQNWKLTRDDELLHILLEGLTKNFNRYGYFSCPCRAAKADKEKDRDIICPCLYSRPDIEEYGHCYCGLYMSSAFFETKKSPKSIPERRYP
ncbi:MAG: ferredoxin:thioredoxin reductase [Proteobacteria bacterium]|nr:ferredoxin:thioredoxin reductase [Pseudomonadota bacterium]